MASRTHNSIVNIIAAFCCQFLGQIAGFIVRTVFIHFLQTEYLGINGLFTNILQVLSLAELGVSAALIYSMYKPMAEKDEQAISMYIGLYKKIYSTIGLVVLAIGFLLMPFLDFFISARPDIPESLELIYALYVIRTASTYFFAYKQSVFQADQKNYIISRNTLFFTLIRSAFEIIVLVVFGNFLLSRAIAVGFTYLQNIWIARLADKTYPFIKGKAPKANHEVVRQLVKNVKAMFMHKVSAVVLNSTDNIILSKHVGIVTVGLYSNYSMILVLVRNCLYMIFDGIVPSVGNLCAVKEKKEVYSVFKVISYGNMWLTGFCSLAMFFLFEPFITIWAGPNYLLGVEVVLSIVISFYIQTNMRAIDMFRSATGLFYNDRYVPIAQCLINLVVSIIFVKRIGVAGIFIGTSIAMISTVFWVQPLLVYKKIFEVPVRTYFIRYFLYTAIWIVAGALTNSVIRLIQLDGIRNLLWVGICVTVIPNAVFVLATFKTSEFNGVLMKMKEIAKRTTKEEKRK